MNKKMNKKILNWIDEKIFSIPFGITKGYDYNNQPEEYKSILIIKLAALGDSVCLLPLIQAIKKDSPNIKIDVLAHPSNKVIFEGQPFIDNLIEFNTFNILKMYNKYDLTIDAEPFLNISACIARYSGKHTMGFSHGRRSYMYDKLIAYNKKQHIVQTYLDFARKLGIKCNTKSLVPLMTSLEEKENAKLYLKEMGVTSKDFVVGICPGVGSSVKQRQWPTKRFAELADKLIRNGKKIIFIDSADNEDVVRSIMAKMHEINFIDATKWFNLKTNVELAKRCNVMICCDSGFSHIVASMNVKVITLFGVNTPVIWAPYGKGNVSIFKPKKGCSYLDNTNRHLVPKKLTKSQLTCMDAITVNDVLRKI